MSNLVSLIEGLVVNAAGQNGNAGLGNAGLGNLGGLGNVLGGLLGGGQGNQAGQGNSGGLGGSLGSVLGGLGGQNSGGQSQQSAGSGGQGKLLLILVPFVLNWIQQQGGFHKALENLSQSGLGQQVQSWVSNGENQPVQPAQLASVFPAQQVQQVAEQANTSTNEVYGTIASLMPQVVNAITANGQATGNGSSQQIQQVLGLLGGLRF
jgi:uncharacterized protein YidB (DUF937 family)